MSPFKTLLLPKNFDFKTLSFEERCSCHLIGIMIDDKTKSNKEFSNVDIEIIKCRYDQSRQHRSHPFFVSLDKWYELVEKGRKDWNAVQKREDKNTHPTLTIREGLICDNCKKQCNSPCIELTNNAGEKTTHCLDCLTNILHVFKNYK